MISSKFTKLHHTLVVPEAGIYFEMEFKYYNCAI